MEATQFTQTVLNVPFEVTTWQKCELSAYHDEALEIAYNLAANKTENQLAFVKQVCELWHKSKHIPVASEKTKSLALALGVSPINQEPPAKGKTEPADNESNPWRAVYEEADKKDAERKKIQQRHQDAQQSKRNEDKEDSVPRRRSPEPPRYKSWTGHTIPDRLKPIMPELTESQLARQQEFLKMVGISDKLSPTP